MNKLKKGYEKVDVYLDDDVILKLSLMAHEQDITFNELCENIIHEQILKLREKDEKLQTKNRRIQKVK